MLATWTGSSSGRSTPPRRRPARPLGLGALDVVLQADPHDEPQAAPLELRLAALVERLRPAAVGDARLELVVERHAAWGDDDFGLLETLKIARQLHATLGRGRALGPQDLSALDAAPGPDPASAAELAGRASDAAAGLATAGTTLNGLLGSTDAGVLRDALFAADRFGVPGATPLSLTDPAGITDQAVAERARRLAGLQRQAATVEAEVDRRVQAAGAMPAADAGDAWRRSSARTSSRCRARSGRRAACPFDPRPRRTAPRRLQSEHGLAGRRTCAKPPERSTPPWPTRMPAAPSMAPRTSPACTSRAQLGGPAGERWVALEPARGPRFRVGGSPRRVTPTGRSVGRGRRPAVDEWVEVVPSADVTTSVAFHYDAPGASRRRPCCSASPQRAARRGRRATPLRSCTRRSTSRACGSSSSRIRRGSGSCCRRSSPARPGRRRDRARRRDPHGARAMSRTFLVRTEARGTSGDLASGLACRVADPLWLLGRQWQIGELQGEDAGSPVGVDLAAESAIVSRFRRAGQTAGRAYDPAVQPLDVLLADPVRSTGGPWTAPCGSTPAASCCAARGGRPAALRGGPPQPHSSSRPQAGCAWTHPRRRLLDVTAGRIPTRAGVHNARIEPSAAPRRSRPSGCRPGRRG